MASRQWDELILQTEKESIGSNEHRLDLSFSQRCENVVDFVIAAGGKGNKSQAEHLRGSPQVEQLRFCIGIVRIYEHPDYGCVGDKLV